MVRFAYLGSNQNADKSVEFVKDKLGEVTRFQNAEDMLGVDEIYDSIIYDNDNTNELIETLKKIRSSDKYFLTSLFLVKKNDDAVCFSDGYVTDSDLILKADKINSLSNNLDRKDKYDWKSRLLAYLYTRPESLLVPKISWTNRFFYYYPKVELFAPQDENYLVMIDDLVRQNILDREKPVDHFFCCLKCFSPHLKFTARCPECASIRVKSEKFLHCFTCGLNAPEKDFFTEEQLICPKCYSKLKLFGSDYDRPLETSMCLDCNNIFSEPEVEAVCMVCGEKSSTEKLKEYTLYELILTDIGRDKIQSQLVDTPKLFIDNIDYIGIEFFVFVLDWFMRMQCRYNGYSFAILGFRVPADNSKNSELFNKFCMELKSKFRDVDICTRSQSGIIWVLLPATGRKQGVYPLKRLEKFLDSFDFDKEEKKIFNIAHFISTEENIKDLNANLLLKQLGGKL